MVDPAAGDVGGGSSAATNAAAAAAQQRAAEEAQRKAAAEAAAKAAAEERARQAAEDRLERRLAEADGATRYQAPPSAAPPAAAGPTYSVQEAQNQAASAPLTASDGGTRIPPKALGSDTARVDVRTGDGAAAIADNWVREGKAEIGMGSPAVYDSYMREQGSGLVQAARIVSPDTAPSAEAMLNAGDTEGYVNLMMRPAMDAMSDLHPDATFEILTVERDSLGTSMPGGEQIYTPQTVLRMTEDGQAQDYVVDASQLLRPTSDDRVHDALVTTPGAFEAWNQAEADLDQSQGDAATTWSTMRDLPTDGADHNVALGLMTMDGQAQSDFLKTYGQTSDIPLGILRPIDTVPPEQTILTVDATGIARGDEPSSLASTVNVAAVDGIKDSTALPPPAGMGQTEWRKTLDTLAAQPPSDLKGLRMELEHLSGGVLTDATLSRIAAADGNALPAILNLVQDRPSGVTFDQTLNLSLLPAGRGMPATFSSMTYDAASNSVVVETSLNRLIRGDGAQELLAAETYGVQDMPMTVRIPIGDNSGGGWESLDGQTAPTKDQLATLNGRIQDAEQASVFLHGYQSDRGVWTHDMGTFMEMRGPDTIGIAFSGMGAEGGFLGSGDSPLTPKQYGFETMEALDRLGLYGKDLTIYGHSMGGAAALQMGLATDRMVASGEVERPSVDYVLLEPAPSGDSVPFLTGGYTSVLIGVQNSLGSLPDPGFHSVDGYPIITGDGLAAIGNDLVGGLVVGDLMPGAPGYIQSVHANFDDQAGFRQLKATAGGLVSQSEPDPDEIAAFMANNHVLVIAGEQDKIVSTEALRDIFNGRVFVVPGNHYAHLPSSIAEQNTAESEVWPRIRDFLHPSTTPVQGPR